jgi:hypothetical protein
MIKTFISALLLFPVISFAQIGEPSCETTVAMAMNAEQWVDINEVNVFVTVNASAKSNEIPAVKENVMTSLSKFGSKITWHLTEMNQKQGASGLFSVEITAVASIPSAELSGIYEKVEKVSKSGMKMSVSKVDYMPDEKTMKAAKKALRKQIYQQSSEEAKFLSTLYPKKFHVQSITFNDYPRMNNTMLMGVRAAVRDAHANVASSQKLTQTARGTFAAGCK